MEVDARFNFNHTARQRVASKWNRRAALVMRTTMFESPASRAAGPNVSVSFTGAPLNAPLTTS